MSQTNFIEETLMANLKEFYSHVVNLNTLLDVLVKKKISLRLLDWFVTNYSKKNDISYKIRKIDGSERNFIVYQNYKNKLNAYPKKIFDPFCRNSDLKSLTYTVPDGPDKGQQKKLETAVCQLNFFKWAIENLIINYVIDHHDEIYDDMQKNGSKSKKNTEGRRKKNQLSTSAYQGLLVRHENVRVQFGSKGAIKVAV